MASDASARRTFSSLVAAAFIDGRLTDAERQFLYQRAQQLGLSRAEAEDVMRLGQQRNLTVAIPATLSGKQALFDDLLEIVCSDGRAEVQERQMLGRFATHLGMDPGDFAQRLKDRLNRRRSDAPPVTAPRREAERIEHPQPVQFIEEPARAIKPPSSPEPARTAPEAPLNPMMEGSENLLAAKPGPISLNTPMSLSPGDLPPITRELVRNAIRFGDRDEAVQYVLRHCGISDMEEARRIVDRMMAEDPECKAGAPKLRYVQ
ncbi:MAG: TerB family tellurite resistance protein [Planctomycetes bacterium]|nr:TerB family tellurite resistance protein [Planctomycetota bacterium]